MDKNIQVDLSKCDDVNCECGNGLFMRGFTLKRVPGLLIGQPKDNYVPVNELVCTSCMKLFVPPDNKEETNPISKIEIVN